MTKEMRARAQTTRGAVETEGVIRIWLLRSHLLFDDDRQEVVTVKREKCFKAF